MTHVEAIHALVEQYINGQVAAVQTVVDDLQDQLTEAGAWITELKDEAATSAATIADVTRQLADCQAGTDDSPAAGALKSPAGLVCVDPAQLRNVTKYGVNHYVLEVAWSSVESSRGVYDWSLIDNALTKYGDACMTLRIQAGGTAPAWLKAATGAVSVFNPPSGKTVDVCHWWEALALDSWQHMIAAAGARYDADPRVVLVSADEPMTVFSEPFIMGDGPSGAALFAAGCNKATHAAAIKRCVADTIAAFPTTRAELAIHSAWQVCTATGLTASWSAGRDLALELCTQWGQRLVISDYGLSETDTAAAHKPTGTISTETDVYAWMMLRSNGGDAPWAGPTTYQLTIRTSPATQAIYAQAAQNAYDLGAWHVEHSGWGTLGALCPGIDAALKSKAERG